MAFSDNQLIFAGIFFVVFVIFIALAYRKDVLMTPNLSKGVWKVVAGIVAVFGLFYLLVRLLG
jgi:uncharacterized membrane protein (DUF485 family)